MALFGTDKKAGAKKSSKPKAAKTARKAREMKDMDGRLSGVLMRPWLSEKALIATEKRVYAFEIPQRANKKDVMMAVEKTYKVVPVKVAVVNLPAKKVSLRTRRGKGTKAARRKAYVYLAEGDSIQFA
jgi:ribosomal protein L23